MRVIVGLGNPGPEYVGTRHNVGVMLVNYLGVRSQESGASSYGWRRQKNKFVFKTPDFILIKTASMFMNESGNLFTDSYLLNTDSLYVAHDDLDLKLGEYKVQRGKGPKVHYGVQSVEAALGTKDFWRIRIGVDNRSQESGVRSQGEEYVLQKFTPGEREMLNQVLDEIVKTIDPRKETSR